MTSGSINRYAVAALLTASAFSPAAAQVREPTPSMPEVAVTGRGEVRVAPDFARLLIAVSSRSSSANAAAADNAARVARTIAALRAAGVDSALINTASYSVNQDYDKNRPSGFIVYNGLRVEVRRIADVGKIIDAALNAGATQVTGVQFSRLNVQEAKRSALALAVAEARRDAEVLAQAAGGTLGKLLYITSGFASLPPTFEYQTSRLEGALASSGGATPMLPGDLSVVAVANARWQFLARQER